MQEDPNVPYGYCQCGCGQLTNLARQKDRARGYVPGEPYRFLAGHRNRRYRLREDGTKLCFKCNVLQPAEAFNRNNAQRDGLSTYCRACRQLHNRATYDARRVRNRAWYAKNKERQAAYERFRRYGVTAEQYAEMLITCGERCAACRSDGPLHVDHDHATGRVRGLLCHACNVSLGLLKEDRERLLALMGYLDKTKEAECLL